MILLGRIVTALILGILLAACHKKDAFATISDGQALQRDCGRLLLQPELGDIPKSQWPKSIEALNPLQVVRHQNDIQIVTFRQPGKLVGGYYVYSDPQFSPSTKGVWIQKTATRGIYIFKSYY